MPNITRALDELGRFVIPKEMRDSMKLRAGDQLEIVCTDNGLLIRKYVTIPLLLIGLFFGFRYRFSGPELERDSINDVMENVASTAADMGRQVMDELHLQYEKRTRDRDGKE